MQFLCKLLLSRNDGKRRRCYSAKSQPVSSLNNVQWLEHFVADPNIHMKACEHTSVHPSFDRIAAATFGRSVQLFTRFSYKELKVIVELDRGCVLQHYAHLLPALIGAFSKSSPVVQGQIDIFRGSRGANPQLHRITSLQDPRIRSLWSLRKQSRQKAIKGDLPAQALQVRPFHLRPRLQSGF